MVKPTNGIAKLTNLDQNYPTHVELNGSTFEAQKADCSKEHQKSERERGSQNTQIG
jgi:hypothetical protein